MRLPEIVAVGYLKELARLTLTPDPFAAAEVSTQAENRLFDAHGKLMGPTTHITRPGQRQVRRDEREEKDIVGCGAGRSQHQGVPCSMEADCK